MGHDPYMVGGGNFLPNPSLTTVTFKIEYDADAAVSGLETGQYDIIDDFMNIQHRFDDINGSTWGKVIQTLEWGWQELGYNQYSPFLKQ